MFRDVEAAVIADEQAEAGRCIAARAPRRRALRCPLFEFSAVIGASVLATIVLTAPLAFEADHVGRVDNFDGQFSIWNVAWTARTLVVAPTNVFHANIFFPTRYTLAFSEHNLGAGLVAAPIYWATSNPLLAYNFVLLMSFVLSATGMYYLARHLTGDRCAASVAAVGFAFCPYMFARTAHIQLLMTAGLPFGLLAWHRLVEQVSVRRAVVLGLAVAAQAMFCGYYTVFLIIVIGLAAPVHAAQHGRLRDLRFWGAHAVALTVALLVLIPILLPYLHVRGLGFRRTLSDAEMYSANWRAYLASGVPAHGWLLRRVQGWNEVLFPGVTLTVGTAWALVWTRRQLRDRDPARYRSLILAAVGAFAMWLSFGPAGHLYSVVFYAMRPAMEWLRAPARFGVGVTLACAVLSAFAVSDLRARRRFGPRGARVGARGRP